MRNRESGEEKKMQSRKSNQEIQIVEMEASMRSSMTLAVIAAVIGLSAGAVLAGDAVRNTTERVQDRVAIAKDKAAIADDAADLNRLSDLVMRWDDLRKANAGSAEAAEIQLQIAAELKRDIRENAAQTKAAAREVNQSRREVRSDRREIRADRSDVHSAATSGNAAQTAEATHALRDDRRDRRDDRRDKRDDIRDLKTADQLMDAKRTAALELRSLQLQIEQNSGDVTALQNHQAALLERYVALSRQEVQLGVRELREDRREVREDRRETHEDIRQK
jgi:hypothetical protein